MAPSDVTEDEDKRSNRRRSDYDDDRHRRRDHRDSERYRHRSRYDDRGRSDDPESRQREYDRDSYRHRRRSRHKENDRSDHESTKREHDRGSYYHRRDHSGDRDLTKESEIDRQPKTESDRDNAVQQTYINRPDNSSREICQEDEIKPSVEQEPLAELTDKAQMSSTIEPAPEKKPTLHLKMKLKNQPEKKRKVSKLEEQAMEILAAEKRGLHGAGTSSAGAIEVVLNDRLGTKTRVKCLKTDTIGQLKQLIAVQVGVRPEKIRLQKWYTVFKDHITLDAYEILDGMSIELYYN